MPGSIVPAEGKYAYVTVNDVDKPFDAWHLLLGCDKADLSNFNQVEAFWTYGLPSATVVLSGPYDQSNALNMFPTFTYDLVLGISTSFGIPMPILITSVGPGTKVRDIARVEVSGLVNFAFLTDPSEILQL